MREALHARFDDRSDIAQADRLEIPIFHAKVDLAPRYFPVVVNVSDDVVVTEVVI